MIWTEFQAEVHWETAEWEARTRRLCKAAYCDIRSPAWLFMGGGWGFGSLAASYGVWERHAFCFPLLPHSCLRDANGRISTLNRYDPIPTTYHLIPQRVTPRTARQTRRQTRHRLLSPARTSAYATHRPSLSLCSAPASAEFLLRCPCRSARQPRSKAYLSFLDAGKGDERGEGSSGSDRLDKRTKLRPPQIRLGFSSADVDT